MAENKKKTANSKQKEAKKEEENVELSPAQAKKLEKRVELQILKIFGFLVLLVVVFIVARSVFEQQNTIEYEGLTFVKEVVGDIEAYKYSYYFPNQDGGVINYNLYVRNNPLENNVPVVGDPIVFLKGKRVYVSVDNKALERCEQSILAVADLGRFLAGNQILVRSAILDEEEAERLDQTHITCANKPGRTVIEIEAGDETNIEVVDKCHRITVNNCEILPATEKYIIQSILDAKRTDDQGVLKDIAESP